ncbi:centromere protein J [Epinephelus fuscoguttatus]|uniref:centromere protein J n=1 Tax=Epinephelus fuscoguttatus TaxID=293821 RepID=UPI0020D1E30F|nr:centromere protein J [Epinephelus fuscoguttatus]XP_049450282.1 centromere protein J [Epinephelus fuscoguttatus]
MSSSAGLQYSQTDFLARWMPSSSRAGVILSPCPDLAGSLRHVPAMGAPSMKPDDSFASDFAPLPASADSSCIDVDGGKAGTDRPVNCLTSVPLGDSDGELDSLDEMASTSQDLPLMMKLEQLRKWQQHIQEQLKAHQLEELLHLQEEQQRLLGMVNGSPQCTEDDTETTGLPGAEWGDNSLQGANHHRETMYSPTLNCLGVPQGSTSGLRHEQELSSAGRQARLRRSQNCEVVENEDEGSWSSRGDDEEQSVDMSRFHEHDNNVIPSNGVALTEDFREADEVLHDRPIKPGIGGQKKTFEELLEEELRLEEQRLKSAQQQQSQDGVEAASQAPPKKPFLKRGEGLSRFTNNRKTSLPKIDVKKDPKSQRQARVMSCSNSEPAAIQRGGTNGVQGLPVQRKTATLNKENRMRGLSSPPQDIRAESKAARMKVLGSHQRQNTEGPESIQTETKQHQLGQVKEQNHRKLSLSAQVTRNPGPNTQPNPVTKQVGMLRGPERNDAAREKSCGSRVESTQSTTESGGGGDRVPQDSFELSFQEKLQRWDCDRQLESMELGEFELLEQAAEELSFSSNSSFVIKVLQMDQLVAARGLHLRRLSSTPIKSPPRGARQRCSSSSSNSSGGLACKSSSVTSDAIVVKMRDDALKNKVSVEDKDKQDSGTEDKHENYDVSSSGGSEPEDQEVVVRPPVFPSTLCFPAQSNPPYDKRSYQDEDSCRDSASDVTRGDDGESDSVLSHADESTLIEDKDGQQGRVVFDDDDTWNDLEDAAVSAAIDSRGVSPVSKATANGISPPARTLLRKVAVSKVVELDKGTDPPASSSPPPPASQLMTRLFPSLKPKTQNAPLPPPPAASAAPESKKPEEETGQQVQSRLLRERLAELEIEIERFKKENAALAKLRQENEKHQENLRKERLEFEQMKAEELAKFEEYKKEENRKLQKERKLFEKHASAARAMPDKKEREEIQALKQQLSSLQEELRGRESRWASTHSRLRQQIDSLSQENSSLRDEIRMLEKLRLSAWKKNPVTTSSLKDKETKDAGLRISESNVTSVTKGVKFASPLDSRGRSNSCGPPQSSTAAATRGSSKENSQGAAGVMKSSLRRPAGSVSFSSSSSLPGRRTEERSPPASTSQDTPPNQEHSHNCSPARQDINAALSSLRRDSPPREPECSEAEETQSVQEVITHPDGKIEKVLASGDRLIMFPNGTKKEVSADGLMVKVTFFNGDTKEVTADQRVIYFYADAQTTHITYPDGMEVLHFPNNQTEKHFPDGRKEITFPDQTVKNLFPNGREESVLTDGTIIQVNPDGTKEIHFNTGQKEIHTADYKRREYPDGTVKTVYTDGRQETRYPTGRLRIKDKDGNVIVDNRA